MSLKAELFLNTQFAEYICAISQHFGHTYILDISDISININLVKQFNKTQYL